MNGGKSSDIAIVGGGIIGCLTAYLLSTRGVSVTVIEAEQVAAGASGYSGGWLTPYSHTCDPAMLALSPTSLSLHRELAELLPEETGVDHGFEETPYLRCALTEDGADQLIEWHSARTSEGVIMDWIAPEDARAMCSWITADMIGAIVSHYEPAVDSRLLTQSAMQAAQKHGARLVIGRATGLAVAGGGRAEGVRLEDGSTVAADAVVLAMGPWTGEASEWIGSPLPITPQRGQMIYLAPPAPGDGPPLEAGITAVDTGGSIFRKRLSDTIVAATREDGAGFDRSTTQEARAFLLERAAQLSSRVATATVSGQTACLRPMTPDGKPYVGAAPGWDNVHIAAGHASEGIYYAPVTAYALSSLIADGQSPVDIAALTPSRAAVP